MPPDSRVKGDPGRSLYHFRNWSAEPSFTDPPLDSLSPYKSGQDITAAWHAFDETYHYFRIDLSK